MSLIVMMLLTACGSDMKEDVSQLEMQLTTLKEENQVLKDKMQQLQVDIEALTTENNVLQLEIEKFTQDEYTLYSRDVESWEIVEVDKLKISKNLNLEETIQALCDQLSEKAFKGLPIELKEIKEVNGEQIAVISLNESDKINASWMEEYFQGSTGGQITTSTLEETLLQRELKTKWIDGIQLLYNNEKEMLAHMEFGNIIYR